MAPQQRTSANPIESQQKPSSPTASPPEAPVLPAVPALTKTALAEQLVGQLGAVTFRAREAAQKAIVRLGPDVFEVLRSAMGSPDLEISTRAVRALHSIAENHGRALAHQWTYGTAKDRQAVEAALTRNLSEARGEVPGTGTEAPGRGKPLNDETRQKFALTVDRAHESALGTEGVRILFSGTPEEVARFERKFNITSPGARAQFLLRNANGPYAERCTATGYRIISDLMKSYAQTNDDKSLIELSKIDNEYILAATDAKFREDLPENRKGLTGLKSVRDLGGGGILDKK